MACFVCDPFVTGFCSSDQPLPHVTFVTKSAWTKITVEKNAIYNRVQWRSPVFLNRVNVSPQGEWSFCKGEWKKQGGARGEWNMCSYFFVFSSNLHLSCLFTQHVAAIVNKMANFKRSSFTSTTVSNLSLQTNRTIVQLIASLTYRLRKCVTDVIDFTERCHVWSALVTESLLWIALEMARSNIFWARTVP